MDDYDLPLKVLPPHFSSNIRQIDATLRSYQKEGVNWLAFLNKYNLHGILCDDMGLGKTLQVCITSIGTNCSQAICIMASDHIKRAERYEASKNPEDFPLPSLVICPSTLVSHWEVEIEKFCQDRVETLRYVGSPAERRKLRNERVCIAIFCFSNQF